MRGKKIWKTTVIIVYNVQQRPSFEWMNDTEQYASYIICIVFKCNRFLYITNNIYIFKHWDIINIKELTCWK